MEILNYNDTIDGSNMEEYEGRVLIVKPKSLKEEYRRPEYQLFKAHSGFGCSPDKMGSAVFGEYLFDKDICRMERSDFLGIAKDDVVEKWKREFNID